MKENFTTMPAKYYVYFELENGTFSDLKINQSHVQSLLEKTSLYYLDNF